MHWKERHADIPLTVLEAGPDGVAATLRAHVRQVRAEEPDTLLTVVVGEEVGARRWRHAFSSPGRGPGHPVGAAPGVGGGGRRRQLPVRRPPSAPGPPRPALHPGEQAPGAHGRHLPGLRPGTRRPAAAGGDDRPGLRSDRPHPAGGAVRLHRLPRGGAGPARRDRTGAAGPGRGGLGPVRGDGAPRGDRQPLPGPDHRRARPPGSGGAAGRGRGHAERGHPGVRGHLGGGQAPAQPVGPVDPRRPLCRHPDRRHLRPLGPRGGRSRRLPPPPTEGAPAGSLPPG